MGKLLMKECARCKGNYDIGNFVETKSTFFPDGYLTICNICIEKELQLAIKTNNEWNFVNCWCQWANIPFLPAEWTKIYSLNGEKTFVVYARMFSARGYETIDWGKYNAQYLELRKQDKLEEIIPDLLEEKRKKDKEKWGQNYSDEDIVYLENLYVGIMNTQNVAAALQLDQAQKLCKISLLIEEKIRAGQEFDKILGSYDKIVKIADFTPKSSKNANDFDSIGEIFAFLEKRGWVNKYYDGASKDIVDETMKNVQAYIRRLYVNESGIGEEIERKMEALKNAEALENSYLENELDNYEKGGQENFGSQEVFEVD